MKVKPIRGGMWSNWHKTKAKQRHVYLDRDLSLPTVVKGSRYIWHYHKYHSWFEKRRFNLRNSTQLSLLFHGNNRHTERYKILNK